MRRSLLILALLGLAFVCTFALAEDAQCGLEEDGGCAMIDEEVLDEDEEEFVVVEDDEEDSMEFDPEVERAFLESMSFTKNHADFSVVIPKWNDNHIPSGELIECVIGVTNLVDSHLNISVVRGSMMSPSNPSTALQNYTAMAYNEILSAGEEISLLYYIRADPYFEPRDYVFSFTMLYEDSDGRPFIAAVANISLNVYEPVVPMNWSSLAVKGMWLAATVGTLYVVYLAMTNPKLVPIREAPRDKTMKAKKPVSAEEMAEYKTHNVSEEYLPDHVKKHVKKRLTKK